jgi:cytosine/adenosine deaminase-related metal-dependent hydrolase
VPLPTPTVLRIDCLAIEDALAVSASPGSLLLELADIETLELGRSHPQHAHIKVLAAGPPSLVDRHPAVKHAEVMKRPMDLLIPGMVNAHSHLDLTHIGPRPFDASRGFRGFIDLVRQGRVSDEARIAQSVRAGIESSLSSGVVAVGDIAGAAAGFPRVAAYEELLRSPLWGVSYLEFFAIGSAEESGIARMTDAVEEAARRIRGRRMRLGLSPHAPYSVSRKGYLAAAALAKRLDLPMMTHVAETAEECELIASASGPLRAMLTEFGIWNDALLGEFGKGLTPTAHLGEVLGYSRAGAVHCNSLSHADLGVLMDNKTPVVFCPRASAYFRADETLGPHRYTDLMFCGVKVGLGTDSVVNLWREGTEPQATPVSTWSEPVPAPAVQLSIFEEMRLLYRRDAIRAMTLLGMATMDGAAILGLDPLSFTFKRDARLAGVVAVSTQRPNVERLEVPLDRVLMGNSNPELLLIGK